MADAKKKEMITAVNAQGVEQQYTPEAYELLKGFDGKTHGAKKAAEKPAKVAAQ